MPFSIIDLGIISMPSLRKTEKALADADSIVAHLLDRKNLHSVYIFLPQVTDKYIWFHCFQQGKHFRRVRFIFSVGAKVTYC